MTKVTKTLNPLHFEDLEPHRFEDLVRQLIYDLKSWRLLEPTGRMGSDDGYDARGQEIVDFTEVEEEVGAGEENDTEISTPIQPDRLWQIQCKREKSITPQKIEKYMEEMIEENAVPYGVIFTAPCDFSKKTRDAFINKIREKGVQEFYLWGRADLEDLLFQPKNDYLLFAYFGISLQIRKRSQKSQLLNVLSLKRKLIRILGGIRERHHFKPVLVRDINDTRYPYSRDIKNFKKNPSWKVYYFNGYRHDGITILIRKFYAFLDRKSGNWDFTAKVDLAKAHEHDDPWNKIEKKGNPNWEVYSYWSSKLQKDQQVYFEIEKLIPFEKIIEIDADGDPYTECPHLFVDYGKKHSPFAEGVGWETLVSGDNWYQSVRLSESNKRIKFFPKKFPNPEENKSVIAKENSETNLQKETKKEDNNENEITKD